MPGDSIFQALWSSGALPGGIWCHLGVPGMARGPHNVLFGTPVHSAVHICWGPGCQTGRPGQMDPCQVGGKMLILAPTIKLADLQEVDYQTINQVS